METTTLAVATGAVALQKETEPADLGVIGAAKILVLYHAHCTDGFAAALMAWACFGDDAEYIPVQHGRAMPPEVHRANVETVYILDFSYPRSELEFLATYVAKVVVIDHHKTAQENLRGLTNCLFDMEKSGAVLAFEYFREHFPDRHFGRPQELLLYVQDRDLWKWELEHSREVSAALWCRPRTFIEWAKIIDLGKAGIAQLWCEGKYILRAQSAMVESIVARRQWVTVATTHLSFEVPCVNTSVLISEACERLLELTSEATQKGNEETASWAEPPEFVAAYFDQPRVGGGIERVWSLRGRPDFDVSEVAKAKGGGGHAAAAGFTEVLSANP